MTKGYTSDPARSSGTGGYNLMEMMHECDQQHVGHRRGPDGYCAVDGEILSGWPCDVHGPSRRMDYDEWVRTHAE